MATQTQRLQRSQTAFSDISPKLVKRFANNHERFLNSLRGMDLHTLFCNYMEANSAKGSEIESFLPCVVLNQISDLEEALTPFIEGEE